MSEKKAKFFVFIFLWVLFFNIIFLVTPHISKNNIKKAFATDTQNILTLIGQQVQNNSELNLNDINNATLKTLFNIENSNYESVIVTMRAEKIHIRIVGKERWKGYTSCGTIENIVVVEGNSRCV